MSTFLPILFRSTDAGAPTLTGEVGKLTTILDEVLCIKRLLTAAAAEGAFNDNSVEARLEGGTTFTLFPGPTDNDRAYFGLQAKFNRLKLDVVVAAVGGVYVWEYWNGSAWTSFSPTDGTSGFTVDGTLTWTISGLTGWATTAVDGVTAYWIRVRATTAPGTNPTFNTATTGWTVAFSGTNKRAYHQGGGNGFYLRVDDNATGTGGAKEALVRGFETMTDVDTGTGPFPTAAQSSLTANSLIARKSFTADATTRSWVLLADDRVVYFFALTGDVAGSYLAWAFGDIFSLVASDGFRVIIIGRAVENSAPQTNDTLDILTSLGGTVSGHYLVRSYTGVGGSTACGKHSDSAKGATSTLFGAVTFLNPEDGGLYLGPIWVHQGSTLRGRLRGMWCFLHTIASVTDGDTFAGVGALSGKSFLVLKQSGNAGVYVIETSDTWETN